MAKQSAAMPCERINPNIKAEAEPMYTNGYDDDFDSEAPLPQDLVDDDDELPEMLCPNCRGLICEDTQKCPHCGDWIIAVDSPTAKWHTRRWMLVAAVMLMLLAMWRFIVR